MKKWILAGTCVFVLFFSACKTTDDAGSLAEQNELLKVDIEDARARAIAAGAEEYFPNELTVVDVASTEAHVVYEEGGDEKAFNKAATDILDQYRALEQSSIAASTRDRIDELDFVGYDPASYDAGEVALAKATELFNSGADGKTYYDESKKAADAYLLVLNKGFSTLANEERGKFLEVKAQADGIKAGVADKDNYSAAVVFFTQGDNDLKSNNPENALENFRIARTNMTNVYETVVEKRMLAEEAIERAKQRTAQAEEVAVAADAIVPLADVEALDAESNESTEGVE